MKPILFTGAGASCHLGYPACASFFDTKEGKALLRDPDFNTLARGLTEDGSVPRPLDLEEIMTVVAAAAGLEPGVFSESRTSAYFRRALSALHAVAAPRVHPPDRDKLRSIAPEAARNLDTRLKRAVVGVYGKAVRNRSQLDPLDVLLSWLVNMTVNHTLPVFTTNYDSAIEQALRLEQDEGFHLHDGFALDGGSRLSTWRISNYADFPRQPDAESRKLNFGSSFWLYKLHGSVDWEWYDYLGERRVVLTTPDRREDIETHAVIYPAFKGVPSLEVFRFPHHMLRRFLCERDVCVVVGFSFRDDFINSIFCDSMVANSALRILLIDADEEAVKATVSRMKEAGMDESRIRVVVLEFGPKADRASLESSLARSFP